MKLDELKAWAHRQPFGNFTITLNSAEVILIDSPDALLFPTRRPEFVIAFESDGHMYLFEDVAISSLIEAQL